MRFRWLIVVVAAVAGYVLSVVLQLGGTFSFYCWPGSTGPCPRDVNEWVALLMATGAGLLAYNLTRGRAPDRDADDPSA